MFNPFSLIFNSIVIALSIAFVIIMAWYDLRKRSYQYFITLLFFIIVWHLTNFIIQFISSTFLVDSNTLNFVDIVSQIGFIGTNIMLYALISQMAGFDVRFFRGLVIISLGFVLTINILPIVINPQAVIQNPQIINNLIFLGFSLTTIFILWRYRQKLTSRTIQIGTFLIVMGQVATFLNPALLATQFALPLSGVGILMISSAFIRQELIIPLRNRSEQLESMHEISISLTSGTDSDQILNEITKQITHWLDADASLIFLVKNDKLYSAATYNLPIEFESLTHDLHTGIAGESIRLGKSIRVENYTRDWHHEDDLPEMRDILGSVISVPLYFEQQIYGALLVIIGKQGRIFSAEDERRVEMLGRQAAVALFQTQSFNEQKQLTNELETTLNQLSTVLESTQNPVLAINRQLALIFANRASIELLTNVAEKPTLGKSIISLLNDSEVVPTSLYDTYRQVRKNGYSSYEFSTSNRDYLCHIAPLGIKRIEGWVIIVNDVTQIKELDRIKSEMIRMTSHDLKNPLQAALANIDLLRDDLADSPMASQNEAQLSVNNIERELEKMHRIISGILDLERVRIAKANFDNVSIETMIYSVIDEVSHIANDKKINFDLDIPDNMPDINCEAQQLQRALVNLIENAIKFSPNNSHITISVHHGVESDYLYNQPNTNNPASIVKSMHSLASGSSILIKIRDQGIGIPEDIQTHIFDRFYRGGQPGAEHVSGTGLGLSLVKAVVDAHNGEVWVNSIPLQGSTFYVLLPL